MKRKIENIISKIKNIDFKLDDNLKNADLISIIVERTVALFRGYFKSVGIGEKGKIFFCGKNVKLKKKKNIYIGNGVTIENNCVLDALSRDGIVIGNNVKVGSYTVMACTGTIRSIGKGIRIGSNCGIGDYSFFGAAGGIQIGDNVIMGQNIRFHSENHNYSRLDIPIKNQGVTNQGITIKDDCWIGAGTVFLDGVTVGEGSVIGANTLVNKNIPAYSVAVGNPVKVIKNRKDIRR